MKTFVEINLVNLAKNYRYIKDQTKPEAIVSAAVKANGYGLGAVEVVRQLFIEGCRDFFVAHLTESLILAECINHEILKQINIYVLHGLTCIADAKICLDYKLVPVLNSLEQLSLWSIQTDAAAGGSGCKAVLNFDTGLTRLGLSYKDALCIIEKNLLKDINISYIMSHLSSSDVIDAPSNQLQLQCMQKLSKMFNNLPVSFANSGGIFLPHEYHFDMVRSGAAIYGINEFPGHNLSVVVTLNGRILQRRVLENDADIGYYGTYKALVGAKLLVVEFGYADGYKRSLSNRGLVYAEGYFLPIIGIVSMDLSIVDASSLPDDLFFSVQFVELIGKHIKLEDIAKKANSNGYEILATLGNRYDRKYV